MIKEAVQQRYKNETKIHDMRTQQQPLKWYEVHYKG